MSFSRSSEKKADLPYAEVMKAARSKLNLVALEIDYLHIRRTVTGGIILEVSGEESAPKADQLAEKLVAILGVFRPVPKVKLRVTGLDYSVTAEEVAAVILVTGGCSVADIQMNGLRPETGGLRGASAFRKPPPLKR